MINCNMENMFESSKCEKRFPSQTPLAICYVPMQKITELYPENTAFEKGTIFPELYFPFNGKGIDVNDG